MHFVTTDVIARSRRRRGNLTWRLPQSLRLPRNDGIHKGIIEKFRGNFLSICFAAPSLPVPRVRNAAATHPAPACG
jgi:hypothetical protein